jgi:rhodanese-related sulfurtransferase
LIPQLSPRDVVAWRTDASREPPLLVDVREPWEFEHCSIDGSVLIPLQSLPGRVGELPRDRDLVLVCHHGNRSQRAAVWLRQSGYPRVNNLAGGVLAWADDVDPQMPRY